MNKSHMFGRRAIVTKSEPCKSENGSTFYNKVTIPCRFLCFGSETSEWDNGGTTDTVAIVEADDGKVLVVWPRQLKFEDSFWD